MEDDYMFRTILTFTFLLTLTTWVFAQNKSVYTNLNTPQPSCKNINPNDKTPGVYNGVCDGVAGYKLGMNDDDSRMSITVITPEEKAFALDFWGHFRNFSYVGEKAEWRMKGKTPVALIIRYNVSDKGDTGETTSYLIVSKITKTTACVTDIVKPGKNQNLTAQKLADKAAAKPCKKVQD
jgi:hypothetical protein